MKCADLHRKVMLANHHPLADDVGLNFQKSHRNGWFANMTSLQK